MINIKHFVKLIFKIIMALAAMFFFFIVCVELYTWHTHEYVWDYDQKQDCLENSNPGELSEFCRDYFTR